MKKIFVFLMILTIAVLSLAACSQGTSETGAQTSSTAETEAVSGDVSPSTTEAAVQESIVPMSEEDILALSMVKINGTELTLPFSYKDLKEKCGYNLNNAKPDDIDESTTMDPHSTVVSQFNTGDGVFDILAQNGTDEPVKVTESEIIAVKLARFYKNDCDIEFEYDGITWDSSADEIKEILGDPISEEVLNDQHLFGYSFVRDEFSNISVSFVADSEKLYSFAVSIDYLNMIVS